MLLQSRRDRSKLRCWRIHGRLLFAHLKHILKLGRLGFMARAVLFR